MRQSRRALSLILTFIMVASIMPLSAMPMLAETTAAAEAVVETVAAAPGHSVDVSIDFKNVPALKSIAISNITFDSSLVELTGCEWLLQGSAMSSVDPVEKTAAITFSNNTTCDGEVFVFHFKIKDMANNEEISSVLCDIVAKTKNASGVEERVDLAVVLGAIKVVRGNLNGDSEVNSDDAIYLLKYTLLPDLYPVTENVDFDESGEVDSDDAIYLLYYTLLPERYPIPKTPVGCRHQLQKTEAKKATCTENGNTAYWYCQNCRKYFSDEAAKNEIALDDTVIRATGHTFNSNHICAVCGASDAQNWKLSTPVITKVEYDTVYWNAVNNADYYTVYVNDNYECTLRGTSCDLSKVKWDGEAISKYGLVSISVQALGHDGYGTSDRSALHNTYFYVPEKQTSDVQELIKYSIGFGYNLIEDEYLDSRKCSEKSVFNVAKLLTIGDYTTRPASKMDGTSYYYKSVDEFISKTKVSVEYGQTTGCVLLGSLKMQINADIGFDIRKYKYNETYIYEYSERYKDHKITNFSDDNLLAYCLSDDFLKDIRKESVSTKNMTDEQLVRYLYDAYGTHAILGIITGGSYEAKYTISTNSQDIAAKVETGFSAGTSGGGAIDQIIQNDFNLDVSVSQAIEKNTSETNAKFTMSYRGGDGGAAAEPKDYGAAVNKWSGSFNEDTAVSVAFTDNGAIPIVTVLSYVDGNLSTKLENYINSKADETYYTLFGIYNKSANLPVNVETVDQKNILVIDISDAQSKGDLSQYSYPALQGGIFTVSSVMCNRSIDAVKIVGAYDKCKNLIVPFSLKLEKQWDKQSIRIILENVGIMTANEKGLLDVSDLYFDVDMTVEYIGQNEITGHNATADMEAHTPIVAKRLEILSTDPNGELIIRGANGAAGAEAGANGQDGFTAIEANNVTVDTAGTLTVVGGDGGKGAKGRDQALEVKDAGAPAKATTDGGDGGAGGTAILCDTLDVLNASSVQITGGAGGDAGEGGSAGWGSYTGYARLPDGANGGAGGNGGLPIKLDTIVTVQKTSNITLRYGNGGAGGDGGSGGDAGWPENGVKPDTGGNGGAGGAGGAGYNGGAGGAGGKGGYSFANEGGGFIGIGTSWQYGQSGSGGNAGKGGDAITSCIFENGSISYLQGTIGLAGNAGEAGDRGTKDNSHYSYAGSPGSPAENGVQTKVDFRILQE